PEARSAAAFMWTNRPSTSCRLAGTARLSTRQRSTSSRPAAMGRTLDQARPRRVNNDAAGGVGLLGKDEVRGVLGAAAGEQAAGHVEVDVVVLGERVRVLVRVAGAL